MDKIAVLTSGGDAPGMNPAIHSVTRTARKAGWDVIGINRGYTGLLEEDFRVLDDQAITGMGRRGGTLLGSSRCLEFREPAGQAAALEILERNRIRKLVVIGGDGSLTGALALHRQGFPVIGLPGTIDNDLSGTDIGIGVDTALNTIISLIDRIKDTATSHERCFIVETMGRSCGYLAAMAAVATQSHVAVVPEFPKDLDRIVGVIERRYAEKLKYSVVVLAEGVCSAGELGAELVAACEGIVPTDIRATVLGHVQRGGAPSYYDRYVASMLAQTAVTSLLDGESGMMVGKIDGDPVLTPLERVISTKPDFRKKMANLAVSLGVEIGDY